MRIKLRFKVFLGLVITNFLHQTGVMPIEPPFLKLSG